MNQDKCCFCYDESEKQSYLADYGHNICQIWVAQSIKVGKILSLKLKWLADKPVIYFFFGYVWT